MRSNERIVTEKNNSPVGHEGKNYSNQSAQEQRIRYKGRVSVTYSTLECFWKQTNCPSRSWENRGACQEGRSKSEMNLYFLSSCPCTPFHSKLNSHILLDGPGSKEESQMMHLSSFQNPKWIRGHEKYLWLARVPSFLLYPSNFYFNCIPQGFSSALNTYGGK